MDTYDVGDMWVNATYPPAKPYTYQNDSLVCKKAKKAGVAFNIAHWQSSSTATTAYLENLGDRIVAGVTDAENKIEAVKKLAEDGIVSATGLANDAIRNIQKVAGDMEGFSNSLTEHTTAIQATNESIALLAQGKQKDESGNVVNISKGGLVTTAYFNSLFSERVEFDKDGHIKDVSKAGLVTTADFFDLFASKKDEKDGYVSTAYISGFIKEEENGTYLSNIIIGADLIRFNGKVVANDTFVVDEGGNLTLNNITAHGDIYANNGVFKGNIYNVGVDAWESECARVVEGNVATYTIDSIFKLYSCTRYDRDGESIYEEVFNLPNDIRFIGAVVNISNLCFGPYTRVIGSIRYTRVYADMLYGYPTGRSEIYGSVNIAGVRFIAGFIELMGVPGRTVNGDNICCWMIKGLNASLHNEIE